MCRFSQSLRISPENPFVLKFLKIGSIRVNSFFKKCPQLTSMSVHPCPSVPPIALTVKGVCVVTNGWYG